MQILDKCNLSALSALVLLSTTAMAHAAEDIDASSVLNMSLAELSNIEVTSVSKKAEKASEAAAAIYVLTNEDIKRSGATSIPEALRFVPGLQVAQSASHQWAVTARGFNGQFANKLLVLIDGRSVYTPIFSGVLWDVQDVPLEDIERIEVIRGPGATVWGANAVNGVINIITKSAKDTVGNYVEAGAGNYDRGIVEARHGGQLENGAYRVYAKYNNRASLENANDSTDLRDNWNKSQAGFRTDLTVADGDNLTVQGDAYRLMEQVQFDAPSFTTASLTSPVLDNSLVTGFNMLTRYQHKISSDSDLTLQAYYDNTYRNVIYYDAKVHTLDFDMQHEYRGLNRQELIWGLGYRYIYNDTAYTAYQTFRPADRGDNLFSGFVQDEIAVVPDEFYFTLGSKFEHNAYTQFEVQPSARFSWLISENHTFWGSVSRAVRTPNRFTENSTLKLQGYNGAPAPGFVESVPNPNLDSEDLIAYELGYRINPLENLALDLATFYNDYSHVYHSTTGTPGLASDPTFGAYLSIPSSVNNSNSAKSYGFELSSTWDINPKWQVNANYSYIDLKFNLPDAVQFSQAGKQPRHQYNIRSTYLFPYDIEMTNSLYYMDQLPSISIDSYVRFDTKLSWEVQKGLELNLVGQNLLDAHHEEFSQFLYQRPAEIGRTVYASAVFRF